MSDVLFSAWQNPVVILGYWIWDTATSFWNRKV